MHQSIEAYGFWKLFNIVASKAFKNERKLNSISNPALYGPFHDLDGKNSHVMASLITRFVKCKSLNSKSITCWGNGKLLENFFM